MKALISTVFNEGENIKSVLADIKEQTEKPDELIFVDGGSADQTTENLKGRVKLIVIKGASRSQGRNAAIESSSCDVIAVCDGGTRLKKDWFEKLTRHFSSPDVDVVCGFFKPEARSFFEKCLAGATIPIIDEVEEDKFLPSSRSVAFRKYAWKKVGGYPEWLPICEDLIFDIKLKLSGFKFKFEPDAIVYWRPRSNAYDFIKQYYLYARGDGHAKLWTARHLIRYTAYLTGFLFVYLSFTISFLWLLPFFAAELGYFSKFFYRYLGHFRLFGQLGRHYDDHRAGWGNQYRE